MQEGDPIPRKRNEIVRRCENNSKDSICISRKILYRPNGESGQMAEKKTHLREKLREQRQTNFSKEEWALRDVY